MFGCRNLSLEEVVVTERLFSSDSSFVAFSYYVDNGAMGQSPTMSSVVATSDTSGDLTRHRLPCFDLPLYSCYYPDKWIDNRTLQVFLNERPFVKAGRAFDSTGFEINGVFCKVVPNDYSYHYNPLIEYYCFSENQEKLLVAYRYRGPQELNISVIDYGADLPRIGNVFTNTEISFNPVVFVSWNGTGLNFFLNDASKYAKSKYVNKNSEYSVNFVDAWKLKESNMQQHSDSLVLRKLISEGQSIWAEITVSQWRKPNGKSQFYYEYEYQVDGNSYRSYFSLLKEFEEGKDYLVGDSLIVVIDKNQPLIHERKKKLLLPTKPKAN